MRLKAALASPFRLLTMTAYWPASAVEHSRISKPNRGPFAVEFFATMRARIAQSGPPPIGLNMAMGATAPAKIGNLQSLIAAGVLAPVELIAVSPS